MSLIALLVLIFLVIAAAPAWSYSRGWGFAPSGVLSLVLAVAVVLALMGRF